MNNDKYTSNLNFFFLAAKRTTNLISSGKYMENGFRYTEEELLNAELFYNIGARKVLPRIIITVLHNDAEFTARVYWAISYTLESSRVHNTATITRSTFFAS